MLRLLIACLCQTLLSGFVHQPVKVERTRHKVVPFLDVILAEPSARFAAVATLTLSGLLSKVAQSPLGKERQVKPSNMTGLEWRENQVAMWNLNQGDGFVAKYFVREWARRPMNSRYHIVEDLDAGVRIRWVARQKYLSASEERFLEQKWLDTQAQALNLPLPLANSTYLYPKRATRTDAGGIDLIVIGDSLLAFRSSYAPNEPIKQTSERRLLANLDQDLSIAYSAVRVSSSSQS